MTEPNHSQQLARMITGNWHSQAVYAAAKLGIADMLADGPLSAGTLAERTGTLEKPLYRLLRALASLGVFAEDGDQLFSLTPTSDLLRRDVPGSLHALAVMCGEEQYVAWGQLLYSLRTGRPAFEKVYQKPVFDFLAENPEQAAVFDRAMVSVHGRESAAIIDAYDFGKFKAITDIGGGNGSMLCEILTANPELRATLFDLPGPIGRAEANIEANGLTDRIHLVDGDFFESVPPGADAYLLRHIIHDWDNDCSIRILQNVRRAIPEHGRLLILEGVIAPGDESTWLKLLDLTMLTVPGGQERTADEYRFLFGEAGFHLSQIVPTASSVSVIEGVPV